MRGRQIANGVKEKRLVELYEKNFAKLLNAQYGFSFWKGRVALYAILKALGIGPGDEIIIPGFTCVVVPNAVRFLKAVPVYSDILPETYNLDPEGVEKLITPRTRAIIIQHTFGIPADITHLLDIANRYKVALIEDCAHSLGSMYQGKQLGTFGNAAFFSSQWSKPYTTGLGGMAVISDEKVAKDLEDISNNFKNPPEFRVLQLAFQYLVYKVLFSPRFYWLALGTLACLSRWHIFVGSSGYEDLEGAVPKDTSWRMSEFQARVGIKQLEKLKGYLEHRQKLAAIYEERLKSRGWPTVVCPQDAKIIFLRYPVRVRNKWVLLERAARSGIELGSWFESPLHPIRAELNRFGYQQGSCPVAEEIAKEVVNLPLHPRISTKEAERTVDFLFKEGQPL